MLKNQESAILDADDQTEVIRGIGSETLFKNVEVGLQRIRDTLKNKDDDFFF